MTTWITDEHGNRASVAYWGSYEDAKASLGTLLNCSNCSNCSCCSNCSEKTFNSASDPINIPVIDNIDETVYAAACAAPGALDMSNWHTCDTTHCRAGWVVALAGVPGLALEKRFNTELAAMLIYRASGAPINPARFYDSNEDALADMKSRAEAATG